MIYLDYQATTPLAPEAFAAMEPWLRAGFGNPHSTHVMGRRAAAAVSLARDQVGALLPRGGRVVFTSGATEALNMAIIGGVRAAPKKRRKIVTIATEHAAVLDTCMWLGTQGYDVTVLPVGADGLVDLDVARAAITDETALVAAMLVNNEIGVIQPIAALADMARTVGALFLCDGTQGYGRVPIATACDMIAVSAHKIYGPKGIGALWLKDGTVIEPIIHGGGQEGGLRSGTLSPALCAGFGAAAALMVSQDKDDADHIAALWDQSVERFTGWAMNGSVDSRFRGNLNIRRDSIDVSRILSECRGIAFSAGSACASGSGRPSHVLAGLGLSATQIKSSLRIGFGRYTKREDIDRAADAINASVKEML
jgi:cysteine desulfurase